MIFTEQIFYEKLNNTIVIKFENTPTIIAVINDSNKESIVYNVEFFESLDIKAKEHIEQVCENFDFHFSDLTIKENQENRQYYIQNGYVGNSINWWRLESKGYTTEINYAQKYSEEEAIKIVKNKPSNKAWLCEHVDNNQEAKKIIIDGQYLDYNFQLKF